MLMIPSLIRTSILQRVFLYLFSHLLSTNICVSVVHNLLCVTGYALDYSLYLPAIRGSRPNLANPANNKYS